MDRLLMRTGRCRRSGTAEDDADELEAGDAVEVADAGGADAPSGGDGGGGDDPVVGADIDACGGEPGPDAGVGAGGEQVEGDGRERGQDGLDERLAAGAVSGGGAVHAVQQLGGGDGGDADVLVGSELFFQPGADLGHGGAGGQGADCAFEVYEDGGV